MLVTVLGIIISFKPLQPSNASISTVLTPFGITILDKLVQSANASEPIDVIFSDIDKFANLDEMQKLKAKQESMKSQNIKHNPIVADNEDPKAIKYYRQEGYEIRGCRNKFAGSRLSNTRKIKRFRKIICYNS